MKRIKSVYDVIIVGGGPSGLSCGIEAKKAGMKYLILEKGSVTDGIRRFPVNMTFFSTPELLELGDIPFTCVNKRPNRLETLHYYSKIVAYFDLTIKLHTTVVSITKKTKCIYNIVSQFRVFPSKVCYHRNRIF